MVYLNDNNTREYLHIATFLTVLYNDGITMRTTGIITNKLIPKIMATPNGCMVSLIEKHLLESIIYNYSSNGNISTSQHN